MKTEKLQFETFQHPMIYGINRNELRLIVRPFDASADDADDHVDDCAPLDGDEGDDEIAWSWVIDSDDDNHPTVLAAGKCYGDGALDLAKACGLAVFERMIAAVEE